MLFQHVGNSHRNLQNLSTINEFFNSSSLDTQVENKSRIWDEKQEPTPHSLV